MKLATCLTAVTAAAAMASCVAPAELSTVEQAYQVCNRPECSSNSPILGDGIVFDEVRLDGAFNDARVQLAYALKDGARVALDVDVRELVGTAADGTALRGHDLVDTVLTLHHERGAQYEVRIVDVTPTNFWYRAAEVLLYELRVRKTVAAPGEPAVDVVPWSAAKHLCLSQGLDEDWREQDHAALIFRGDRYDGKQVIDTAPDDPRINLACIGTATAKMQLVNHTNASAEQPDDPQYARSLEQRQAMMFLLTASYCGLGGVTETGNGEPFTVTGQPLWYTWTSPWAPPLQRRRLRHPVPLEAIWNARGAVCLDEPRRSPAVTRADVEQACGHRIPRCDPRIPWEQLGEAVSESPP